jgi:iron complex outermembrane receptor protein
MNPTPRNDIPRYAGAGALALLIIFDSVAQSLPPPRPGANPNEVVQLSPFEVSSEKDIGYAAANSTSGSRLNANLRDTAASITVFTPEFLSDFAANSLEDMIAYAPNVQIDFQDATATATPSFLGGSNVSESRFRVRGLPASTALDFFETRIPTDNFRVARFELSSGPNAILFGFAQPGGLVNTTTKKADLLRTRSSVRAGFGSWRHQRAEFDHNQVLVPGRLALRLNAVDENSDAWRHWDGRKFIAGQGSLRFDPFATTRVAVDYEQGTAINHINRPWNGEDQLALWLANGRPTKDANAFVTSDRSLGINRSTNVRNIYSTGGSGSSGLFVTNNANNFRILESTFEDLNLPVIDRAGFTLLPRTQLPYDYSAWGPGSSRTVRFDRAFLRVEQRLGKSGVAEIAYSRESLRSRVLTPQGTSVTLFGDPNTTLPNSNGTGAPISNPNAGGLYIESQWGIDQGAYSNRVVRGTLAWKLDLGPRWGRHDLAGLFERGELRDYRYPGREILVDERGVPISNTAVPENANNIVTRRHYVRPGSFETYYPGDARDPIRVSIGGRNYRSVNVNLNLNGGDVTREITTSMLATQSYFWRDRVVVTSGLRVDRLRFDLHGGSRLRADDPLVTSGQEIANTWRFTSDVTSSYSYQPTTGTLGAVWHVRPQISLFANYANNISQPIFNALLLVGRGLPAPPDGETHDAGFILNLFEGKATMRATAYETSFQNFPNVSLSGATGIDITTPMSRVTQALFDNRLISQAEYDAHHLATAGNVRGLSDQQSRGYEVSLSFNPVKSLTALASFSWTDYRNSKIFLQFEDWFAEESRLLLSRAGNTGIVTTAGLTVPQELSAIPAVVADGRDFIQYSYGNRPYKANVSARYTFAEGKLKGVFIGGGARWQGEPRLGRLVIGRKPNGGAIYGRDLFGPVDFKMDAFAGYRMPVKFAGRTRTASLQVNVRNLTNEDEWMPLRYNSTFTAYSRVLLYEPRSFRVTVDLDI